MDTDVRPTRSTTCKVHHGNCQPSIGEPRSEQKTDEEDQGDVEEEEPEEIRMEIYGEEDPGQTVEDIAQKQDVIFRRFGQSYNFTVKARVY